MIYKFNPTTINLRVAFFTELVKTILKFLWNHQRPWITKVILGKKSKAGGITILNPKLYSKLVVIKQRNTGIKINMKISGTEYMMQKQLQIIQLQWKFDSGTEFLYDFGPHLCLCRIDDHSLVCHPTQSLQTKTKFHYKFMFLNQVYPNKSTWI